MAEDSPPESLDEETLLSRLSAREPRQRFQALLYVKEAVPQPSPQVEAALLNLHHDSSREVRELARFLAQQRHPGGDAHRLAALSEPTTNPSPSSLLLVLISFGSAATGTISTVMSLLHFYVLGSFPFPNPLDVLVILNLVLTIPYLTLGGLLLMRGVWPKRLARGYAVFSLGLALVLIFGLQPLYERSWSAAFLPQARDQFAAMLSPIQLAMALMPLIAGQVLQLFFSGQLLRDAARALNKLELEQPGQPASAVEATESDAARPGSPEAARLEEANSSHGAQTQLGGPDGPST